MAPERLFPSVSFSNLLLCFLCLFPSSRRGPVEPGLTGEERRGGDLILYGLEAGWGKLLAQ